MLSLKKHTFAWLISGFLMWTVSIGSAQQPPEFQLVPTSVRIPERGEVPGMVILTESNRFEFILPLGWKVSSTTSERKITFDARDFKGTMAMKIVPGPTNSMDIQVLRDELAVRFAGSKITEESQCYTSDGRGPAFDLEWVINGNSVSVRIGFVPFAGGIIEFSLTATPENFGECRLPFGNLLTSFGVETRLPKGTGG
jgi:hypothetical protein